MDRVGHDLIRKAEYAEGSVFGTRVALSAVCKALRDLEDARRALEQRRDVIERMTS